MNQQAQMLRIAQVARLLSLSTTATYRAVNRGELPCVQIGKIKLIPKSAVEALIQGRLMEKEE